VQAGSRNVYADLGFPNPDAMLRKARIASEISACLKKAGLTQVAAARRMRLPQATFLRVMRGEFTQVAEGTLKKWRARLAVVVDQVQRTRDQ
jgi:predicted XRE-type DNA-binding protein